MSWQQANLCNFEEESVGPIEVKRGDDSEISIVMPTADTLPQGPGWEIGYNFDWGKKKDKYRLPKDLRGQYPTDEGCPPPGRIWGWVSKTAEPGDYYVRWVCGVINYQAQKYDADFIEYIIRVIE